VLVLLQVGNSTCNFFILQADLKCFILAILIRGRRCFYIVDQKTAFFMAYLFVRVKAGLYRQFYGSLGDVFHPAICANHFSLEPNLSNKNSFRFSSAIVNKK